MSRPQISLIVTDLDNTLFDWVDIWTRSFSALLTTTARISGIPVEQLEREFKALHQRHGTTEYAFTIEELPSLQSKHGEHDLRRIYSEAIEAFRHERAAALRLYPGVMDTLKTLKARGVSIVGYTESMHFYTAYRLRHLDLDLVLDRVYSPPDCDLPAHMTPAQIEQYPKDKYVPRMTRFKHTPPGEKKPNPALLLDIIGDVGGTVEMTIYVGDSQLKDIAMAQDAGVTEVWAKYGVGQFHPGYELLRRVTHWTDQDVEKERVLSEELKRRGAGKNPRYVLESGFHELLSFFDFIPFAAKAPGRQAELLH